MNYYQFHIGDFRSGTIHMSRQMRWLYRDMLDLYYDSEKPLPLDLELLNDSIGVESAEDQKLVERILRFKFTKTDEGYTNSVCEKVIAEYHSKAETAKANGKLGGRPSKAKQNPKEPSGFPSGSNPDATGNPLETLLKTNHEPITMNQFSLVDFADEYDGQPLMPTCDAERDLGQHLALVQPAKQKPKSPACPYDVIIGLYHEVLPELPSIVVADSEKRRKGILGFWLWVLSSKKSDGSPRATSPQEAIDWIRAYFERARENDFIMANGRRTGENKNWKCNLDYLLEEKGRIQVIEKSREAA